MTGKSIFVNSREAAEICEYPSVYTFLRNVDRLIQEEGFPSPAPFGIRGYRWRRSAVEAWIETFGLPEDDMPNPHDDQVRRVEAGLASGKVRLLEEARRP